MTSRDGTSPHRVSSSLRRSPRATSLLHAPLIASPLRSSAPTRLLLQAVGGNAPLQRDGGRELWASS
jgi:hypothetical protein